MNFYETNPYVRFAGNIKLRKNTDMVYTRDSKLFYILKGDTTVTANDETHKVSEGSVLLWTSGTKYKFEVSDPVEIITVNFDYTQNHRQHNEALSLIKAESPCCDNVYDRVFFDDTPILNSPIVIENMPELCGKIQRLAETFLKKEMYYNEKCSLKFKEIIIDILQHSVFSSASTVDKIKKIINYINSNYQEDISVEKLAKMVNYHPYHLNKLMVKYTSFTTHRYILNLRLEKSKEFLKNKSYSIAQTAEKCGFSSAYHFSASFKKKYNETPSKYRSTFKNIL